MDRFPCDAEARSEQLTTETREQFSELTRAVLAKDVAETKRVADALGSFLGDGNALADLVCNAMVDQGAFQKVLTDVLWAEAAEIAERNVVDMERRRAQSAQDARIEQRVWNHFFSHGVAA